MTKRLNWERANRLKKATLWIKDEEKADKIDFAGKFLQKKDRLVRTRLYDLRLPSIRPSTKVNLRKINELTKANRQQKL
jgi:hypothetical protein